MSRLNYCLILLIVASPMVLMLGCGPTPLKTEYVEGVVTLDGEIVPGATVMFVPATEGLGMSANGFTDENGVYKLSAKDPLAKPEAGTLPGEYIVMVIKNDVEVEMSAEEAEAAGVEYKPRPSGYSAPVTYIVPKKYNQKRTTDLKATVVEGENNIPLELTTK
mgnify:CR=1 FL=1